MPRKPEPAQPEPAEPDPFAPTHSELETFRATLPVRTPDGQPHTLIVTRHGHGCANRTRLTFNGAWKTTVELTDPETAQLADLLTHHLPDIRIGSPSSTPPPPGPNKHDRSRPPG
ncbi:MAG TPA: hypothetical protein VFQ77_06765 [Pseudonocardiaceae bacterium]|jgi:hypothetical protein|nr:hypothetical protein [Pseudonocardiaceae bacterium]